MKVAAVIATVLVLMLAAVIGGPTGMAQDDPETAPVNDQDMLACSPVTDAPADETMDAGAPASPTCTPTTAPDMPLPTDTPTPVPTATPVPTDTPRPTDTPPPATPTETPAPAVPAGTPTSTSGSHDVPVGTLSRQLPFANPGEDQCDLQLDIPDKQSCNAQTFPAVFTINFSPWSSTVPVSVQVDGRKAETTSLENWDFLSVPGGVGAGTHTITASENFGAAPISAKLSVPVRSANSPHFLVYPRVISPGSNARVYLAGFPASTELPLGVYRERQDCTAFGQGNECFELARDLGTVKTDGDGIASLAFSVPANDRQTAYLVATTGLRINPQNAADSLKALGRPWFVVGKP